MTLLVEHIIPWSCQDWRTSKVRMRSAITGDPMLRLVYMEILNAIYEAGGEVSADPETLQDVLALPAQDIARVLPILLGLGKNGRGGLRAEDRPGGAVLVNGRATEYLREQREYRAMQRANGKLGGRPRKSEPENQVVSKQNQVVTGCLAGPIQVQSLPIPSPPPIPPPIQEEATPSIPRKRGRARSNPDDADLLGDEPGGTASWAVKAKRPKGVTPRHLEATVVRILREIRQDVVKVDCCSTAAASVLSLWRALDRPAPDTFAEELVLVARASQVSMHPLFAKDIRGEHLNGDRVDRTFVVSTLCAHGTWDGRLQAARRWAGGTDRVGEGGIALARRRRWLDPMAPLTWAPEGFEGETLYAAYLRCAAELFRAELGGDDLLRAQARLEALRYRPGVSGDLTEVVRLALDATGLW